LHVWGTGEVYTGFWSGDMRERDHLGDLGVGGRILKWILNLKTTKRRLLYLTL